MATHKEQPKPPRWADRLLEWFVAPHLREDLQGDLYEIYRKRIEQVGLARAKREYTWAVLHYLTPFFFKRKPKEYPQPFFLTPAMIRNYLKIAGRSLLKNKLYASVNVIGLALGMACALLIGLWVNDELSYNRYLPGVEDVYFVRLNTEYKGEIFTNENTPGPLVEPLRKDIPEVQYAAKVAYWMFQLVKVKEKVAKERGYYVTEDFFGVFPLPALAGNPKKALADPGQIVITRKMADAYFLNKSGRYEQVLGRQLQLNNANYYTVGAVIEDLPRTSSLRFDWIANFSKFEQDWMKEWPNNAFRTYVRLHPKVTAAKAESSMRSIYARYAKLDNPIAPVLQPMTEFYLYREYQQGKAVGGRIEYVRIFSIVALFILLIACINFMNLATARSAQRAKEIGVRKVVGALRRSLIAQFLSESLLTSLLAALLALGLVWLLLPPFNVLFDKQLALHISNSELWIGVVGLVVLTGFLSGCYPAFVLSGMQPIRTLKGAMLSFGMKSGFNAVLLRRTLVVFQFSLSIFLMVGMLAVSRQMNYLQTKRLGMDRENVVAIPLEGELLYNRKEAFRQSLLRSPAIASAATTNELPVNILSTSVTINWPGKDPTQKPEISGNWVGADFIKTMNITLLAGRDFSANRPADAFGYIINESAAKLMGMTNPIGQEIEFWRGKGPVIGLMKDFHLQSLHEPIKPLIFALDDRTTSYLLVKIRAGQTTQALADMERQVKVFNPNYPFDYQFLDEVYDNLYKSEQQVNALVNYFGMLALLISCLGLFALATFTAEQRTKEIGVRKVLGASVNNIVSMLSTDFLKLVLIALTIAVPLAGWALSRWLNTFQYRTELPWWIFGLAGLLAIGIALATVSFQAIRAALVNPVKSLRSE